jgi:hypothetical protein
MKIDDINFYGAQVKFPEEMVEFWRHNFPEHKMHLDHCTLGHYSNMTTETLLPAYMNDGEECELAIDAVGKYTLPDGNGDVIAFRVKDNRITVDGYPMKGENKTFHITAFTSGKATAKDSNKITDWVLMGELLLSGRIKFWMKEREK